jgi:hypothetical protein
MDPSPYVLPLQDMKQHFAIHSMFQAKMQLNGAVPSGGTTSGSKASRGSPHHSHTLDEHKAVDEDHRNLVLQVGFGLPCMCGDVLPFHHHLM